MVQKNDSAPVLAILVAAFCIGGFTANAAPTVYNQRIPSSRCELKNINACFNDASRKKNFEVGKEVTKLSDLYHFCTNIQVTVKGAPSRIILTLDASGSMCQEVTGCTGASNNDPTNKRVDGANQFLDSVAGRCPTCEVGVIVYTGVGSDSTGRGTITEMQNPLVLNQNNVAALHRVINGAACNARARKIENTAKLAKRALTFTGIALDSAIKMVDAGYDTLKTMDRHIILLTDGDWQKPTTAQIIAAYNAAFSGRPLPTIHGVFISDRETHLAYGFPEFGLTDCTVRRDSSGIRDTTKVPMDMSFLELAAKTTNGKYIPGSTPQTVVATFQELFKVIVDTTQIGLASVTFANAGTGEKQNATFGPDSANPLPGHYAVRVPQFDLAFGLNTFIITWVTQDTTGNRLTTMDTFTVTRQTTAGTGADSVFKTVCSPESVDVGITCSPPAVLMNEFVTVRAAADPNDMTFFNPNNITLRAFTPFPDEKDNRVLFLFHLDDKALVNSALGGQPGPGTGAPTISTGGAFGSCISAGAFNSPAVLAVSGNFSFECWIRPTAASQNSAIATAAGFSFGMKDGYLTATVGGKTVTTTHILDKDVWQHVAVARINGETVIFINGIPMSPKTNTTETIQGTFTIGNFSGGLLDEVRFSNFARTYPIFGQLLIEIPTASNLSWKINNSTPTGATVLLPPEMWQGNPAGQVSFQVSQLTPGPVVVNFFDTLTSSIGPLMWSKNGDPVLYQTNGIPVTATLLDTSHDGHLDRVDLTWTVDAKLKDVLPPYTELIGNFVITTLDGKVVTLQVSNIIGDQNAKTVHVILVQTTGNTMETGWKEAPLTLKDAKMTITNEPFVITKVIDGASPIPVFACYAPSETHDTLKITFSEPLTPSDSLNPAFFLRLPGDTALSIFKPISSKKQDAMWTLIFPYNAPKHAVYAYDYQIQEMFPTGPRSPKVEIDFCYPVSLIDKVRVGPNPYTAATGLTNGPTVTYPEALGRSPKQINGQKIEIRLKRPIVGSSGKQEVQGLLTIFDAVGNVLLKDEPLGMESPTILSMGWDGTNLNKMKVAGGTYLARYVVRHIVNNEVKKEEMGKVKLARKTEK